MHLNPQQKISAGLAILAIALLWQVNGFYMAFLAPIDLRLFWFVDVLQWIVIPTTLLVFIAKNSGIYPKHYGLDAAMLRRYPPVIATLGVFMTAGFAFFLTRNLAWLLLGQPNGFFSLPEVFPSGPMGTITWLYSAITAGVVESIFFIGLPSLLYHHVARQPSRILFSFGVSVVFAMAHWEQGPHVVIAAFFSNLVACAWFFKSASLWPVVFGHTLIDLVAFY